MADVTPQFLRGFILPMDLTVENIWQTESSFTQQNPTAGDPFPLQSSKMRLLAKGNQSTNGDITIVSRKAGSAGFGSRFTFKDNLTSTTAEYGRDAYNAISGFEWVEISSSIIDNYYIQDSLVTSSNTLLIAINRSVVANNKIFVKRYTKDSSVTDIDVYVAPNNVTLTQTLVCSMCELDDGSILLAHILEDNGEINIRVHRSQDDGLSWDVVSRHGWEETLPVGTSSGSGVDTHEIIRVRMESISGSILLLVETEYNDTSATKRNRLFQYVSIDRGGSFILLTTNDNVITNSFRMIDLKKRLGRYVLSYVATKSVIHYMELPNPFSNIHLLRQADQFVSILGASCATNTDDYMNGGDLALLTKKDGSIYLYNKNETFSLINSRFSSDGVSFKFTNGNYSITQGVVFNADDSDTILERLTSVHWLGRGMLISSVKSTSSTGLLNNSVVLSFLGGYSTVNLPENAFATDNTDWARVGYIRNYLPIDLPSEISGLTVFGTGSDSLNNGLLRISSTPTFGDNRYYRWNNLPVGSNSEYTEKGIIIRCSLDVISGGDTTTSQRGIIIETDNGTIRYEVAIYITPIRIVIDDIISSTNIITVSHQSDRGVDIIFAIAENSSGQGKVSGWKRTYNVDETREWSQMVSNHTVTSAASSGAGQRIDWGHLTNASDFVTEWREFHVSTLKSTGQQLATGFTNPDDCASMPYPPLGQFTYVYDNVSISSTDGSTYEGEQFKIFPQFDYPIGNTFQSSSPSPRITWRSQAVPSGSVAAQTISWKLYSDTGSSLVEHMPNDLVGFHFANVNWRSGELFYHNGTTWVSLSNVSNQIRCGCTVKGRTIRGDATMTQPYFTLNELVGWTAFFSVGETAQAHKIVSNTEGKFGGTATGTKQSTITFQTPPPSGATSVYLIPKDFSMVINFNGIQASGFKLVIDSQVTYHNDIRIGEVIIGPVIIPGRQYGRGRTISMESGTETIETQDGMRYSREIRPPQRIYSLAWTDGIDISQLQGSEPTVDYWVSSTTANAEPIAVNNEAPDLMLGFLDYVQGQKKHFVYLPNISKSTSSSEDKRYLSRVDEQVMVTLESDIQIEHVVGDELQSQTGEVFRIATINMRQVT